MRLYADKINIFSKIENPYPTVSEEAIISSNPDFIIIAEKSRLEKGIQSSVIMQMNMQNSKMLLPEKNKKKSFDFLKAASLTLNVFESSFFEQENGVSPREMTSWDLYQ